MAMVTTESAARATSLEDFLKREAARYGVAPELFLDADGLVRGSVVTWSQRRRLEDLPALADLEVGVLEDPRDPRVISAFARVLTRTPIFASPLPEALLASEAQPQDGALRCLAMPIIRGLQLVQMRCGTLGWIPMAALEGVEQDAGWRDFGSGRRAIPGAPLSATPAGLTRLVAAARSLVERAVPYVLGGRDLEAGIDCSALAQLLFERHLGILLPRHSSDQMDLGLRVALDSLAAGDLVFATAKTRNVFHVALALGNRRVIHACLAEGRVIEEDLDSFFARYRFRGARRIGVATDERVRSAHRRAQGADPRRAPLSPHRRHHGDGGRGPRLAPLPADAPPAPAPSGRLAHARRA